MLEWQPWRFKVSVYPQNSNSTLGSRSGFPMPISNPSKAPFFSCKMRKRGKGEKNLKHSLFSFFHQTFFRIFPPPYNVYLPLFDELYTPPTTSLQLDQKGIFEHRNKRLSNVGINYLKFRDRRTLNFCGIIFSKLTLK